MRGPSRHPGDREARRRLLDDSGDDMYVGVVERTTIYLDTALKRRLREVAAARRTTEASILREALQAYLAQESRPQVRPVGTSADGGVAHRVDEALHELGFGRE
jgi:Ribbon-helix-helix protein, copG family